MDQTHRLELEQLGLSPGEAQIYLALLNHGSLGASAIATATGIPRTSVYPTLCSLADKGMVEGGTGYGSRFSAIPPDQALPALIVREKAELVQRELLAGELAQRLSPLIDPSDGAPEELLQVLRSPQVISERFYRLQMEAESSIDLIIKAPILSPARGNPAQKKAQKRGVRVRGLYEEATVEDSAIKPFLKQWIESGEEARVYPGELPHKLVIFDKQNVLLTLVMPGNQTKAVLVRHPQLARSQTILFEALWDRAEPLLAEDPRTARRGLGVGAFRQNNSTLPAE